MTTKNETPTLTVDPGRIIRFLAAVAAILIVLSIAGQVVKFVTGHDTAKEFIPLFHVGTEGNITTYFSVVLLLGAAAVLGWIGWAVRCAGEEESGMGGAARYWLGLAALFGYLSMDEASALHERLIVPVRELLGVGGLLSFAWVIPGMAVVILLGGLYVRFILRLPRRTLVHFGLGAALYLGGAIGMELLGGAHYEVYGDQTVVYSALTTVEETMEMAGVVVFIRGLLLHAQEHAHGLRIRIAGGASAL